MITKHKKSFFSGLALIAGSLIATPVSAANYILEGISCIKTGLCTPCDLIQVGVNATEMILGLSGVVILLIFIYGGLMWMISYGDSKKVEKGSSAIKAAVIGMVIVFVSYSAVELLWQALRGNQAFSNSVQCTPLNIESGGYLGNSETGGGQGAGTAGTSGSTVPDDYEWQGPIQDQGPPTPSEFDDLGDPINDPFDEPMPPPSDGTPVPDEFDNLNPPERLD